MIVVLISTGAEFHLLSWITMSAFTIEKRIQAVRWRLGLHAHGQEEDHRKVWAELEGKRSELDAVVGRISLFLRQSLLEKLFDSPKRLEWSRGLDECFLSWIRADEAKRSVKLNDLIKEGLEGKRPLPPPAPKPKGLHPDAGKSNVAAPAVNPPRPVPSHPNGHPPAEGTLPVTTQGQLVPPPAKWRYLPVASSLEKREDSESHSLVDTPMGWECYGARVRGRKHKLDGTNCDDAFAFRQVGTWTIIAVSDGAGSKKYSRIGAQVATVAAAEKLAAFFAENAPICRSTRAEWDKFDMQTEDGADIRHAMIEAVQAGRRAIADATAERAAIPDYATDLGRPINDQDFSCTLLLATVQQVQVDSTTMQLVAVSQVGDGMIGAINRAGEAIVLGVADSGGHAGETEFITSDGKATTEFLLNKTNITLLDLQSLLVMTDGVADDYFPGAAELSRLWGDLLVNGIPDFDTDPHAPAEPFPDGLGIEIETIEENPKKVVLQSSDAVAKQIGVTVPELLKRPGIATVRWPIPGKSAAERLRLWIDAYQVRGSFDDRALVVFHRRNLT